jgi:serine/threonine protein phosphatase PrpC
LHFNDEQSAQVLPEQPAGTTNAAASTQPATSSVPAEVAAPQSGSTAEQNINGNNVIDDISQAPTQFLTHQRMMEYHKHKWEQDLEREKQTRKIYSQTEAQDIAEQPTRQYIAGQEQGAHQKPYPDIADMPTIAVPPVQEDQEPAQPATSSTEVEAARNATAHTPESTTPWSPDAAGNAATPEVANGEAYQPVKPTQPASQVEQAASLPGKQEEVAMEQVPPTPQSTPAGTDVSHQPAADFPVLDVGAIVSGRYEITQVIGTEAHDHTYQVIDHQGYQRCWNCGSHENSEGDDFCIDCGANLHDAQYVMHEYPASAASENEASVLSGIIVNTFMDQDRTYVIEQPQAAQIAFPTGVHLLAASDSDAGDTRRGEPNEDSTLVLQFQRIHESLSTPVGIFVVADGMGGHDSGQVASRMTISQIADRFIHELLLPSLSAENAKEPIPVSDEEKITDLLRGAIEDANTALCQTNQRDKTDMGSTLTGFMIVGDLAYIFNVGDSRTYMLRDGNLYQLTTDHSLVGQLVAGGMIEPDEVYTHPQRNQIFRSIGDKLNVQIDIFKQQIHPGDVLLSCCDGLWEMVRNPQITDILNNAADPQSASAQLIEAANTNGGEDNISAVVVYVR